MRSAKREAAESLTETSLSASLASDSDDVREPRAEREEEDQKAPNRRWMAGKAEPHNAEEAEGEQKRRREVERHLEPPEAAELKRSLTAPPLEP